jgi:hypothetical protein
MSCVVMYDSLKTAPFSILQKYFLTSALAGSEWSVSRPARFTPRERLPRHLFNRRLGGSQSWSGRCGEEKILDLIGIRTLTPGSSSP